MVKDIATDNSDNAKAIQESDYQAVAKSALDLASVGGTSSVFREPSQSGLDPVTELLATLTGSSTANAATTPFYNAPETNATREDDTNNQGQAENNHRYSEQNENTHNQTEKDRSGSVQDNGQPEKHSQNNQTTQTTDNAVKSPEVSGSLNKLPTDHLPKGVRRVSVKEIYSTKLCSDYDPIKEFNVAATPVPCGANNPYQYNTPEYWIWEWTGHANGWEKAFEIARQGKMCQWNDAKTAAEHYITAQRMLNDPEKSELTKIGYRILLPAANIMYSGYRKGVPHLLHKWGLKEDRPSTSNPSYQQLQYQYKGWWDGLPDNFNKNIDVKFGVCIPKKVKK